METFQIYLFDIKNMHDTGILRNLQTNDLYRHLGGNKFKNLRTLAEGEIPEGLANKILIIDYNATMMLNKYPMIEDLIFSLKLKLESK